MNIEEGIDTVKFIIGDLKASNYNQTFIQAIETLLTAYEKEKKKNKSATDFINDEKNYFEDGENWQNILKIKEILEE